MAPPVTLPPSFTNSFWTSDYRRGIASLHTKIQAGIAENAEITTFLRTRASQERSYSADLSRLPGISPNGFGFDDGASLKNFYEALRSSSEREGRERDRVSKTIELGIANGFEEWCDGWKTRVAKGTEDVGRWLEQYEGVKSQVEKLREVYESKTQTADEMNETARLAGLPSSPPLTSFPSPPLAGSPTTNGFRPMGLVTSPVQSSTPISVRADSDQDDRAPKSAKEFAFLVGNRAGGLARAITQRVTASPRKSLEPPDEFAQTKEALDDDDKLSDDGVKRATREEKGKGKEADLAPIRTNIATSLLEIGGIVKPPTEWSTIFTKAKDQVESEEITIPIVGTYDHVHSGEDLASYFKEKIPELQGSIERTDEFCRQLVEDLGALRLVGELGNRFHNSSESFYLWKPLAFELHLHSLQGHPVSPGGPGGLFSASTDGKKSNSLGANALAAQFISAISNASKIVGDGTRPGETKQDKILREAEEAEKAYKAGVAQVDKTRLVLEERISDHLAFMQRLELDRLRAAKSAMQAYNAAIGSLIKPAETFQENTKMAEEVCNPFSDIGAIIERYKTGNFRPKAAIFENVYHEAVGFYFGVDLRRWAETKNYSNPLVPAPEYFHDRSTEIPAIVPAMLDTLHEGYAKLPNDNERRKVWIYDVPLVSTHHLRERVNDTNSSTPLRAALAPYDLPVVASGLKLWLLEMDPPVVPYHVYDDVRQNYPSVGAKSQDSRVESVKKIVLKLPKTNLLVMDAVLRHLGDLIGSTTTEEDDETYIMKLALSLGRCFVRPQNETGLTLSDRSPPLFFIDLMKHRAEMMEDVLTTKTKTEATQRKKPIRQRTKPVDVRITRKQLATSQNNMLGRLLPQDPRTTDGPSKSPQAMHVEEPENMEEVPPLPQALPSAMIPAQPPANDEAAAFPPSPVEIAPEAALEPKEEIPAQSVTNVGDAEEVPAAPSPKSPEVDHRIPSPPPPPNDNDEGDERHEIPGFTPPTGQDENDNERDKKHQIPGFTPPTAVSHDEDDENHRIPGFTPPTAISYDERDEHHKIPGFTPPGASGQGAEVDPDDVPLATGDSELGRHRSSEDRSLKRNSRAGGVGRNRLGLGGPRPNSSASALRTAGDRSSLEIPDANDYHPSRKQKGISAGAFARSNHSPPRSRRNSFTRSIALEKEHPADD